MFCGDGQWPHVYKLFLRMSSWHPTAFSLRSAYICSLEGIPPHVYRVVVCSSDIKVDDNDISAGSEALGRFNF